MTATLGSTIASDATQLGTASLADDADLTLAVEAYIGLVSAQKLVQRLQREVVLGKASDDSLDDALLMYRRARSVAARWQLPEPPERPDQKRLFAGWLTEALEYAPQGQHAA
jgi:hypothetical protein